MKNVYQFREDDARRFANEQGIPFLIKGDEIRFRTCPYCRNMTDDKNTFSINRRTGQFKCLRESCGARGNMLTISKDFNFSLGREVDEYYNARTRYRSLRKWPTPKTRPGAIAYLEGRGISAATVERYHITTHKDNDNIIVFPFYDAEGVLQFVKYRKADFQKGKDVNKEWCEANCKPILFGMDQCNPEASNTLILTEGQIDSLSVAECGLLNAVSVPTGAKGFTWVPYCWDFLNKFKTLIVFGDCERGKITLLEEMKQRFRGVVRHVREEDYKGCKDANELLQTFGKDAVITAVQNAIITDNPKIKDLADVKRRDITEMIALDSGFEGLNKITGGLFLSQLVILTGERGLGKSTLGSQFITRALDQGYNCFCYSGELMDWFFQNWIDKQIAGRNLINCLVSNLGFQNYIVDPVALEQIHGWYRGRCYIYDNTNIENEDESLLETIEKAITQYSCRVLLIDNLMTAVDDDLRGNLYRQQSAFVRKLAIMAKQYDVLIILVVHPRKRQGYEFSNDEVSGSGNITNLADVILRYAKPQTEDDSPPDCDRVLQVTKNRLNGRVNFSGIKLFFDEPSKRISENGNFNWCLGWNQNESEWLKVDEEYIPF